MTLADLNKGDRVLIESIRTPDNNVQRLMIMGLVEGAELTFVGASLGGDPLEFPAINWHAAINKRWRYKQPSSFIRQPRDRYEHLQKCHRKHDH